MPPPADWLPLGSRRCLRLLHTTPQAAVRHPRALPPALPACPLSSAVLPVPPPQASCTPPACGAASFAWPRGRA
jgi:hypothetical protein